MTIECYFCSKIIRPEKGRYGLLLRQGTENFHLLKAFLCHSCDRSLGDDDIRAEITEILQERNNVLSGVVSELKKNKVRGFV